MWTKSLPIIQFSINNPPDAGLLETLRADAIKQSKRWLFAQGAVTLVATTISVGFLTNLPGVWAKVTALFAIGVFCIPLMVLCDERRGLWGKRFKELSPANITKEEISDLLVQKQSKTSIYIQKVYNQQRDLINVEFVMLSLLAKSEKGEK